MHKLLQVELFEINFFFFVILLFYSFQLFIKRFRWRQSENVAPHGRVWSWSNRHQGSASPADVGLRHRHASRRPCRTRPKSRWRTFRQSKDPSNFFFISCFCYNWIEAEMHAGGGRGTSCKWLCISKLKGIFFIVTWLINCSLPWVQSPHSIS